MNFFLSSYYGYDNAGDEALDWWREESRNQSTLV